MSFEIGNYVVYCSGEICKIDNVVKRCFDGVNEHNYFKLIPVSSKNSSYYIPCDNTEKKVRPLLTKKEILELIDNIPQTGVAVWCDDKNERKHIYNNVLKSNDHLKLIKMMHTIYNHREQEISKGKKLPASDERAMNEAEHLLNQEIAFVLGMNEEEVHSFIENRLKDVKN